MSRSKKNKDEKINKVLRNTFIIFVISGILALVIILNKGVIFGKRLVSLTNSSGKEETHVIQLVATSNFLKNSGDKTELMVSIDGEDRTDGFELTSSDENVVKVEFNEEENKYYAISNSNGTAVITAKMSNFDASFQTTIDVIEPIKSFTLSAEEQKISVGAETSMQYICRPNNSDVKVNITYESSDEGIATVNSSGIVTGVSKGTVTITGTDQITGIKATYKITVTQ